ncbi:MAG: PAS domain-containing protein, partial [Magnetococcales bacterium]|nr:PAS domain-containing protein [Magnetococcales bacterium]
AIENNWLAVEVHFGVDMRKVMIWAIPIGISSLLVIIVIMVWNRKLHREIVERQRIQEDFRTIIDCSPIPYAINDDQQIITYINPAFMRIFGYQPDDIPKLEDWWPKAYPDPTYREWVSQEWMTRLEHAARDGTPFKTMEVRIHCKDDQIKTVLANAVTLEGLRAPQHLVTLFDITEVRHTQRALHTILEERADLLKRIPVGVYQWRSSPEGRSRFDFVSPRWCSQFGVTEQAVMQDDGLFFQAIHPEDRPR